MKERREFLLAESRGKNPCTRRFPTRDVRAALLSWRQLPARQLPVSRRLLSRHILARPTSAVRPGFRQSKF